MCPNHLTQILQFNSKCDGVQDEVTVQEQMFFLHWKTRDGPDEKVSFFCYTGGKDTDSDTETVYARNDCNNQDKSLCMLHQCTLLQRKKHWSSLSFIKRKLIIFAPLLKQLCVSAETFFFVSSTPQINQFPMKNTKSHQVQPQKVMD